MSGLFAERFVCGGIDQFDRFPSFVHNRQGGLNCSPGQFKLFDCPVYYGQDSGFFWHVDHVNPQSQAETDNGEQPGSRHGTYDFAGVKTPLLSQVQNLTVNTIQYGFRIPDHISPLIKILHGFIQAFKHQVHLCVTRVYIRAHGCTCRKQKNQGKEDNRLIKRSWCR